MILSADISHRIVVCASTYLGKPFDYEKFNCVHFVRSVYEECGITLPLLERYGFLPRDFHLTIDEFSCMPLGHSVFFKRKAKVSERIWSHVGIIIDCNNIIHCTRHLGRGVVITPKERCMEVYDLAEICN